MEVGAATAAKIVSRVKSRVLEERFKSASAIVDEVTIHSLFKHSLAKETRRTFRELSDENVL